MFHVSFLVKHHQVLLSVGERGLPVLEVARRSRDNDDTAEDDAGGPEQARPRG